MLLKPISFMRAASGASWTPATGSGIAWWDADDSANRQVSGSDVTQLDDKIASFDLPTTNTPQLSTASQNSKDGVSFLIANNEEMAFSTGASLVPSNGDFIVAWVGSVTATEFGGGIVAFLQDSGNGFFQFEEGDGFGDFRTPNIVLFGSGGSDTGTTYSGVHQWTLVFDRDNGNSNTNPTVKVRVDGTEIISIAYNTAVEQSGILHWYANRNSNGNATGIFYEGFVLSDLTELSDAESYLDAAWGL